MPDFPYQPYYCEENIWQLCQQAQFTTIERYVLFISNPNKQCALWFQKAAPSGTNVVIWDYHVVMIARTGPPSSPWEVWDLDTTLDFPMPLSKYLQQTFQLPQHSPYAPLFRLIEAELFLSHFSSDRSHMLDEKGNYLQPPPAWSPPRATPIPSNLMKFIDFRAPFIGEIFDLTQLKKRFDSQ